MNPPANHNAKNNDNGYGVEEAYLLHQLSTPTSVLFSVADFIIQPAHVKSAHRDLVIARSRSLEIYSYQNSSYVLSFIIPLNSQITALDTVHIYPNQPKSLVYILDDHKCYIVHYSSNDFETVISFATGMEKGPVAAQFGPFLKTNSHSRLLVLHTVQGFLHVVTFSLSSNTKSSEKSKTPAFKHHYLSVPFWDITSIELINPGNNRQTAEKSPTLAISFTKPNKASTLRIYSLDENYNLQLSDSEPISLSRPKSLVLPLQYPGFGFLVVNNSQMNYYTIKNSSLNGHKKKKHGSSTFTAKANLEQTIDLPNKTYISYYFYIIKDRVHLILGSRERSIHLITIKRKSSNTVFKIETQLTLEIPFTQLVYCGPREVFVCNNNGASALLSIDIPSKRYKILKRFETIGPIFDYTQCEKDMPFYTCSTNGHNSNITRFFAGQVMETLSSFQCQPKAQNIWYDENSGNLVLSYFDSTDTIPLCDSQSILTVPFTASSTLAYANFTSYHIQVTPHAVFQQDLCSGMIEDVKTDSVQAFITNQFVCVSTYQSVFLYTHTLELVFEYTVSENIHDILCNEKYLVISLWQSDKQVIFRISDLVKQMKNLSFSVLRNPSPFFVIPIKAFYKPVWLEDLTISDSEKLQLKEKHSPSFHLLSSIMGTQQSMTYIVRYFSNGALTIVCLDDSVPESMIMQYATDHAKFLEIQSRLPLNLFYSDGVVYCLGETSYCVNLCDKFWTGMIQELSLDLHCPTFCQSIKIGSEGQSIYVFGNNAGDLILTNPFPNRKSLVYRQKYFSGVATKIKSSSDSKFVVSLLTKVSGTVATQSVNVHEGSSLEILDTLSFNTHENVIDIGIFWVSFDKENDLHFLVLCELFDPAMPKSKAVMLYCKFDISSPKIKVLVREYFPELPVYLETCNLPYATTVSKVSDSKRLVFNLYWSNMKKNYTISDQKPITLTSQSLPDYDIVEYTEVDNLGRSILNGTFTSQDDVPFAVLNNAGKRYVLASSTSSKETDDYYTYEGHEPFIPPPFIYQHISEQVTKVVSLHGSSFVEASPYLTPKSIITTVSGALYVLFSVSIESSILADLPRFGSLVTFHEKEGDSKGSRIAVIEGQNLAAADAGVFNNPQVDDLLNSKFLGSFITYFGLDTI